MIAARARVPPSAAEISESRQRLQIPAGWEWEWCANDRCAEWVWYDPAAREATLPRRFIVTCGLKCSLAVIETMP
jgi:hypothetical protein